MIPSGLGANFAHIRAKYAKYEQNNEKKITCCWGPVEQVKLLTQKARQDVLMIPNGLIIHATSTSEMAKKDKNQKGT